MAVPFYGYDWETTSCHLDEAKTYPGSGKTLTYRAARQIITDRTLGTQLQWDDVSLSPYLTYQDINDDGEKRCHIGFFENERSLAYKIDMVNKLRLGGIAVWALGYEGEYDDLWQKIDELM